MKHPRQPDTPNAIPVAVAATSILALYIAGQHLLPWHTWVSAQPAYPWIQAVMLTATLVGILIGITTPRNQQSGETQLTGASSQ